MPRYKLRVPQAGDVLYGDGLAFVADTEDEARRLFMDEHDEPWPALVHSHVGRCRVVYARDVEAGDCHEDAEPGDTTIDYCRDDGGELGPTECRVWELGPPRLCDSTMRPVIKTYRPEDVPAGCSAYHRRLGSGNTTGRVLRRPARAYLEVDFNWPGDESRVVKWVSVSAISIGASWRPKAWPPPIYELIIDGETIAEGDENALRTLRDLRQMRLRAEWEARKIAQIEAQEMVA